MISFAKRTKDNSLTAVIPQENGLSIASIAHDSSHGAVLKSCAFTTLGSGVNESQALQKQAKKFGLSRKHCTTILDIGDYSILSVEAPDVPPNELKQAIRWQIKDLIDFHIDDAVLDIFDAPASGADGRQRNLYVVVSKLSVVQKRVSSLQNVDINLTTIDVPELVLRNITAQLPEDETGVAMIYLAKDKGLLVLTREKTLYLARVLDMGFDTFEQGTQEAEALSLESFNPVYDRLVLELQRTVDYYDRYFVQPPIAGIVFAPMKTVPEGLCEYVSNNLGVPTRILDLNEIIKTDKELDAEQQVECLMAIGAAMRSEKKTL